VTSRSPPGGPAADANAGGDEPQSVPPPLPAQTPTQLLRSGGGCADGTSGQAPAHAGVLGAAGGTWQPCTDGLLKTASPVLGRGARPPVLSGPSDGPHKEGGAASTAGDGNDGADDDTSWLHRNSAATLRGRAGVASAVPVAPSDFGADVAVAASASAATKAVGAARRSPPGSPLTKSTNRNSAPQPTSISPPAGGGGGGSLLSEARRCAALPPTRLQVAPLPLSLTTKRSMQLPSPPTGRTLDNKHSMPLPAHGSAEEAALMAELRG